VHEISVCRSHRFGTCKQSSGLSSSFVTLSGGASRQAALLLLQILPVLSGVAPGHPGAALENPLSTNAARSRGCQFQTLATGCQRRAVHRRRKLLIRTPSALEREARLEGRHLHDERMGRQDANAVDHVEITGRGDVVARLDRHEDGRIDRGRATRRRSPR
jgi:hypothetical protein